MCLPSHSTGEHFRELVGRRENTASILFSTLTQIYVISTHKRFVRSTFHVTGSKLTVAEAAGFPLVTDVCSAIRVPMPSTSLLLPYIVTFQKLEPVTLALVSVKVMDTPTAGELLETPSTNGPPLTIATAVLAISTPVYVMY